MRYRAVILLLLGVAASLGADYPCLSWERSWEPIRELTWEAAGTEYALIGAEWRELTLLADDTPLSELPSTTIPLGVIEGRLYTAFEQRLTLDAAEGAFEQRFLTITAGTGEDYAAGTTGVVVSIPAERGPGAFALAPGGDLLALAWADPETPSVEIAVHGLPEGDTLARRSFTAATDQLRARCQHPAFSSDGETLFFNLHPHAPASDEFLDLQPLLAWHWTEDDLEELTAPLGWVLPVRGRTGRRLILLEEYPGEAGYGEPSRWLLFDPRTGEVSPAFSLSVNNGLYAPDAAAKLFDGDPDTSWTPRRDSVVDIDLGAQLPLDTARLVGGDGDVVGWGLAVEGQTRRRDDPADPARLSYSDTIVGEVRLILSAGIEAAELELGFAFAPVP